ncbi:hypothetical protein CAEBREN_10069 [Caenorhabditis brenneri]|uniref:Uncharacterized protein n=1 Tax=Caenorhabditis brenneri TaxID=135651 RepID=G0MVR1_CAEBE|nr:hypothetical protein CAEBREN_10069 [Caenorhabditis brenneri]
MVWDKLLIVLVTVPTVLSSFEPIECIQCAGGSFAESRYFMQDKTLHLRVTWQDAWNKTNCDREEVNNVPCTTRCLNVTIADSNTRVVEGYLLDCFDNIIDESQVQNDLPFFHSILQNADGQITDEYKTKRINYRTIRESDLIVNLKYLAKVAAFLLFCVLLVLAYWGLKRYCRQRKDPESALPLGGRLNMDSETLIELGNRGV